MFDESVARFMQANYMDILAVLPVVVMLAGLLFTICIDPYIDKQRNSAMLILIALVFSLILQDYGEYLLMEGRPMIVLRRIVAIYGYSVRPVILVMFDYIIDPRKNHTSEWIMIGVNAAIHSTALFSSICFTINEENHYVSGLPVLSHSCLIVSLILLGVLLYHTCRGFQSSDRKDRWIPIFVVFLILFSLFLDDHMGSLSLPISFLTIDITICCLLYYIWLHFQFAREHEQAMQTERRVQLMLSQIRPHFLYNTLGAIEELCDSDPAAAREATVRFSDYLRGNMEAISAKGLVPFEKELSHTRLYLELEQMRFEDALQVHYDIRCKDFSVPALTLEPIVENAVRHGIRSKPDGRGTVSISTRETEDSFEVIVEDDGPGFDPASVPEGGTDHVGIHNVRTRLKSVCGGELLIDSKQGRGTRAVIRVPNPRR